MQTIKNTHEARNEYKTEAGVIDATNIVLTINQMMTLIQDRKAIAVDMGDGRTVFISTKIPDDDNITKKDESLYAEGKQVFEVEGLPNVDADPKTEPRNEDVKDYSELEAVEHRQVKVAAKKPAPRKRK